MTLTDQQLERYARHIVLPEIGGAGQQRLVDARVAVVGAGGLGAPLLQYLAAAGVGYITLIDDDEVDLSNLQRQVLHGTADIGMKKTASAKVALKSLNAEVRVDPKAERLTGANAAELLGGHDVIADGSDSFATRGVVADTALALKTPLVSAAVGPFDGQLGTFEGWKADQPCWRCFAGNASDRPENSCAERGILGAVAGIMGSMQALEVIRSLVPFGEPMAGRMLFYDACGQRMRTVRLPKDPDCPACHAA
ncbi:molybdopterin biosynthesis protein MoeB [Pacificimonas flava]|uniref:Molybdopterin-synthase adenylyltransferase n=2 Tax=Pacificimonas TaxID=1960290 RepID=A0A219B4W7_9SPHN|nr:MULTISPECIES: molybdopterin-synthase adenylyltransferase MoeB [Pacificimonas]MBZ6377473.1 molybdopterin-synthase adenylyltransferase MoeB [Pacificimonas aurantium]OWV32828.1 molybdopterin biosynthesis protein MoeB [Pacificimonas flava]